MAAGAVQGQLEHPLSTDSFDDYGLQWLFDPGRVDHLPIEEQLLYYKQPDLKSHKVYKMAAKIWGAPRSRKRVITAPPMATFNTGDDRVVRKMAAINAPLKEKTEPQRVAKIETKESQEEEYKNWVSERKKLRSDLENMGLSEEWLTRKPDKTPLEQRVLRKLLAEKYPLAPSPPPVVEEPLEAILPDEPPLVKRPSPMAIRVIEHFLYARKMRLIDLFKSVDKDKNWKITRDEFRNAIKEAEIPISEVLLEDLILALDTDLNNELDYRELAKGMGLWRLEKRDSKRKRMAGKGITPTLWSQFSGYETPEKLERLDEQCSLSSRSKTSSPTKTARSESSVLGKSPSPTKDQVPASESPGLNGPRSAGKTRARSALSTISSGSSQYLEPPDLDLRPEQMILSSEEAMLDLRKRDREALARMMGKKRPTAASSKKKQRGSAIDESGRMSVIKTGDPGVDHHNMPSTMGGETAELVDKFRQLKYKEYCNIAQLCKKNNIPLSESLLQRVLLYPPDKPHCNLKHKIIQPGMPLLSAHLADPPKREKTPVEEKEYKESIKVSKTGKLMIDSRRAYPSKDTVYPQLQKMTLSTGKCVISRQVDCWMSYEEYEQLTRNLALRYTQLHGQVDDNAFWPGRLLDKMRLVMPNPEPRSSSIFRSTGQGKKSNLGYNNDLQTWPFNDSGYLQIGFHDPYKNKYI